MANTVLLKRRIRTAQNVSKATRAMQMIATSKLKRSQIAALASRPYVEKLSELVVSISDRIEKGYSHPYLKDDRNTGTNLFIVISPDKGLCGGMIANLTREYIKQIRERESVVMTVGKKIESTVVRSKREIIASFSFGNSVPSFAAVYPIVKIIDEYFLGKKVDNVYVIYTHFKSVFTQSPTVKKLLPLSLEENKTEKKLRAVLTFEPSLEMILPDLLKHYIEIAIYQYMLESFASEQASRMTAMQSATDNANDIIEDLKLIYNKSRQEKITSELLDIAGSSNTIAYE